MKAIEAARGKNKPVLAEKTIERHFSAMRQLWKHLGRRKADQEIFAGIENKVMDGSRSPWTEEALDKLLRASWEQPGGRVSEETLAWMVGMGGYIGGRAEEYARVRVRDVQEVDGVWCMLIGEQVGEMEDGQKTQTWMPKTPAGCRAIPIHAKLIEAGLLDLVQQRREMGADRLFDLSASGPGDTLPSNTRAISVSIRQALVLAKK